MKPVAPDVFRQLLDSAHPGELELTARVSRARDAGYWRGLVGEAAAPAGHWRENAAAVTQALDEFARDGILHAQAAIDPAAISAINGRIDAVLGEGWPGVFAFVYDEPWSLLRSAAICGLIEGALGKSYFQIPHIWTHVVKPGPAAGGWAPHVDGTGDVVGANRLSLWVALNDATLDNGCMYAVGRAPDGDSSDVTSLLQRTRALPASAGDILGWAFDIVHWGAAARPGNSRERRSLSFEFIASGTPPDKDEVPLLAMDGPLPAFNDRLRMIATAIFAYRKFEPLLIRYEGVAGALLAPA